MRAAYERWINAWENRLAFRATNRVVRPFEWGLEWTAGWPSAGRMQRNGHNPEQWLQVLNRDAIQQSDEFYRHGSPARFDFDGKMLRFESPVRTPYPENNIVHGSWFPAKGTPRHRKAVLVLPHWNASAQQHVALCQGLSRLGLSALRVSLPYHDHRMPAELERADYAVSSNLGRTLDATRQAVIDVRCCTDWLEQQGFERIGIVGTSLGSCYAFMASAHDPRIAVNVFNHCSTYFADVVWTGLSTRHIRQSLEKHITLERLRECWAAISPVNFMDRFAARHKKSLFIYTSFDTTFLPEFSRHTMEHVRKHKIDHKEVVLPCGHYTLGETPYKFIDGYHICSFLKKWL